MATPISFIVPQFETSITAVKAVTSGADPSVLTCDATATVNVTQSQIQSLFSFYSDGSDVDDSVSTDLLYRVNFDSSALLSTQTFGSIDLNSNTTVTVNNIINSGDIPQFVAYDFTRHIADCLFNADGAGTDLFSNEQSLRTSLQSSFVTSFNGVLNNLTSADTTGGKAYTTVNPSAAQIVMLMLMNNRMGNRFDDLDNLRITEGENWYRVPIMVNDTVQFKLIIAAASDQETLTGASDGTVTDRSYKIIMNITSDSV